LILTNKIIELELEVDLVLIQKLFPIIKDHLPNEFGGIIVGYYSNDFSKVTITEFLNAQEYKSSRYYFERGIKGLKSELKRLYNKQPKEYYVGEWHSHPNGSTEFSMTDLSTMQQISNRKSVKIENPLLLIISVSQIKEEFQFYLYSKNYLTKYE